MNRSPKRASEEYSAAIGYDGECHAQYDGFVELDTDTWEPVFEWNSYGYIGLDESFVTQDPLEERCEGEVNDVWDFLHFNSIDKFANGDYLLSGRPSNAIYRISRNDGSVVWRLGGKKSDFDLPITFSGQHAAKIRAEDDNRVLVSFLDNAFGPGEPQTTNDASRGLLLALDTNTMTVEVVQEFKHPDGEYTEGQGNLQWVPGTDHAWICWRNKAMHTEHAADGSLIMEARFKAGVRNYRSFKLQWVGRPAQPPDVRSTAVQTRDDTIETIVFMSWNGATEVRQWQIYETNPSGTNTTLVATVDKTGFETTIWIKGYLGHVLVEAVDALGEKLGEPSVFATVPTLEQLVEADEYTSWIPSVLTNPMIAFLLGMIASVAGCLGAWGVIVSKRGDLTLPRWKRKQQMYASLSEEDKDSSELHDRQKHTDAEPERSGLLAGEDGHGVGED